MSKVVIAKSPDLSFLTIGGSGKEKTRNPLPMILKDDGSFDWEANHFLTTYAGGATAYNISPIAETVLKKAYSLNIFCDYIDYHKKELFDIDDSFIYQFVANLKKRNINDESILNHSKNALKYLLHLNRKHPSWKLATNHPSQPGEYKTHYYIAEFFKNGRRIQYPKHRAFDGLIHIHGEADFIRDHELIFWFDSINHTSYHPNITSFLSKRWLALGTILDITGSRITEAHRITRSMIKNAARSLSDLDTPTIIRGIPILKGKLKGKTRDVPVSGEDLQIILSYIFEVENKFPKLKHDALFVDSRSGSPLKSTYIKNYAKKVISKSSYSDKLSHLSNHSFRHRFITLNIAKTINKLSKSGGFYNIFTVASNVCRKLTMHASNQTLSRYIHLASDITDVDKNDDSNLNSTHLRLKIASLKEISNSIQNGTIEQDSGLQALLNTIDNI